jgi:5'-phosphate synthase pdxT subunit
MAKFVGVLALQGDFAKHLAVCQALGVAAKEFREPQEIPDLAALIIPGGESTTIGMLMERRGLLDPLRLALADGLPCFGTCAGAILLANTITDSSQSRLGGLDVTIERNAYGSQIDSFEARLDLTDPTQQLAGDIEAVFIRAPRITQTGAAVQVLASFANYPVLVRQNRLLAACFHPELTNNPAIHRYFLTTMAQILS